MWKHIVHFDGKKRTNYVMWLLMKMIHAALPVKWTRNTCRSFFNRDFASTRHGVVESIFVTEKSSATRAASSNMWLRGKAVKQSNTAFRRNFIASVLLELLLVIPDSNSKLLELELPSDLSKISWRLLKFFDIGSGNTSMLRSLSFQLELFVQILERKARIHSCFISWITL
jgi:hypothetical protein